MPVTSGNAVLRFAQDDMTHLTLSALMRGFPPSPPATRVERALPDDHFLSPPRCRALSLASSIHQVSKATGAYFALLAGRPKRFQ